MTELFPHSVSELTDWSRRTGISANEARQRLVQFGILMAISRSERLRRLLVFKGGNALDFMWLPNRSTQDLDFTAYAVTLDPKDLRDLFDDALRVVISDLGIAFRVQKVEQKPKGPEKTRITFRVSVGYALPEDRINKMRMARGEPSNAAVPVEVSVNEVICAADTVTLDGSRGELLIATLEDIVAEKLRALLQQVERNRWRKQDLLDLAVIISSGRQLDLAKVRQFLREKARAREIEPTAEAFEDEEVWRRAQVEYAQLEKTTRRVFIPFKEAKVILLEFVKRLRLDLEDEPIA